MELEIEQGSPLYQFIKPKLSSKISNTAEMRFNQLPP